MSSCILYYAIPITSLFICFKCSKELLNIQYTLMILLKIFKIIIIGELGRRMDHTLHNFTLLKKNGKLYDSEFIFVNESSMLYYMKAGVNTIKISSLESQQSCGIYIIPEKDRVKI